MIPVEAIEYIVVLDKKLETYRLNHYPKYVINMKKKLNFKHTWDHAWEILRILQQSITIETYFLSDGTPYQF